MGTVEPQVSTPADAQQGAQTTLHGIGGRERI